MVCKHCAPVKALSQLKAKELKQSKKRWAWVSKAWKLDESLSRRLGTLGLFPPEILNMIFGYLLDEYIEEALIYQAITSPWGRQNFDPSPVEWRAIKDNFKEHFDIRHRCSKALDPYDIFSLHSRDTDYRNAEFIGPAFDMPIRLASDDLKNKFDDFFLSTMRFRFYCQKTLRQFIRVLSPTQLPRVRSITIEIFGCYECSRGTFAGRIKSWDGVCDQLPKTLNSVYFVLGRNLYLMAAYGNSWRDSPKLKKDAEQVERVKRAEELMEYLGCKDRARVPSGDCRDRT